MRGWAESWLEHRNILTLHSVFAIAEISQLSGLDIAGPRHVNGKVVRLATGTRLIVARLGLNNKAVKLDSTIGSPSSSIDANVVGRVGHMVILQLHLNVVVAVLGGLIVGAVAKEKQLKKRKTKKNGCYLRSVTIIN